MTDSKKTTKPGALEEPKAAKQDAAAIKESPKGSSLSSKTSKEHHRTALSASSPVKKASQPATLSTQNDRSRTLPKAHNVVASSLDPSGKPVGSIPCSAPVTSADNQASRGSKSSFRAKADAILASTSVKWYAGAAFDRSPAANTLPKPTKLLQNLSNPAKNDAAELLVATSCPPPTSHLQAVLQSPSIHPTRSTKSQFPSPHSRMSGAHESETAATAVDGADAPQKSSADLREKSRALLAFLKGQGSKEPMPSVEGSASSLSKPKIKPSGVQSGSPSSFSGRVNDSLDASTTSGRSSMPKLACSTAPIDQLEEMTMHVRKLLNISQTRH